MTRQILCLMLLLALVIPGCEGGTLVGGDDDAADDDAADDDDADDDAADDDTADDDTADDDTGDDDTGDDDDQAVEYAGPLTLLLDFWGQIEIECAANLLAEMDPLETELNGAGQCLIDVPNQGQMTADVELACEVDIDQVQGRAYFYDPTGGTLEDVVIPIDGEYSSSHVWQKDIWEDLEGVGVRGSLDLWALSQ